MFIVLKSRLVVKWIMKGVGLSPSSELTRGAGASLVSWVTKYTKVPVFIEKDNLETVHEKTVALLQTILYTYLKTRNLTNSIVSSFNQPILLKTLEMQVFRKT